MDAKANDSAARWICGFCLGATIVELVILTLVGVIAGLSLAQLVSPFLYFVSVGICASPLMYIGSEKVKRTGQAGLFLVVQCFLYWLLLSGMVFFAGRFGWISSSDLIWYYVAILIGVPIFALVGYYLKWALFQR